MSLTDISYGKSGSNSTSMIDKRKSLSIKSSYIIEKPTLVEIIASDCDEEEDTEDEMEEVEVQLAYRKSNIPKFNGEFTNVSIDNRLKRKCKTCGAKYSDLSGFNRHFGTKHT